jgi:hypothetical protein
MDDFIDYVMSFYGPGEIYDMGATRREVEIAIGIRLGKPEIPFDGDSVDREMIRDIILEMRG